MKKNDSNHGFASLVGRLVLILGFLGMVATASAQQRVSGRVVDEAGNPVIGASVFVEGTVNGTTTSVDGTYVLNAPAKAVVTVSFIGYKTVKQTLAAGQTRLDITLEEDAALLDDVVVVGYGTVKKRDLTGAVSSVKAEDIMRTPTSNVMEAIQGQVAGFDITRSTGDVGASMNMTLRGSRSINGSNEPLFIIDGMEGSFDELNPNDIASIEVLKDASSTAVYGAAGANGVIIITTKNPQKDRFSVNFDAYYGWNVPSKFPGLNMGEDYINFRREAARTQGQWSSPADDASIFPADVWNLIQENKWVNWADLLTQTGQTQSYNISTSYATERMSSFFSLGYYKMEGQLRNDEMERFSARAKLDFTPNNYVKYGFNVYAMYSNHDKRYSRVWNRIICTIPLGTPYDEDGNVVKFPVASDQSSPSPLVDNQPGEYGNNIKTLSVAPQFYVEFTPVKGLSFRSVLGGYLRNSKQSIFAGANSWAGIQDANTYASIPNALTYNYKWQNILTYNVNINDEHEFTVTGVTEWTKNRYEDATATAYGFDSTDYGYHNLGAATGTPKVSSSFVGSQMMSYVARLNYSYKGKYLFSVSSRWDGASMLAKGNKWDVFPAVAAGWRISDENFMQNVNAITNLKLRASYGVTGNAGAAEYATLDYSRTGKFGFQETPINYSGFSSSIANPGLGWEKSYSWNVGLDLGLFKDRLSITADWYRTETKDILYEKSLPFAAGGYGSSAFTIWSNVGETRNSGLELTVSRRNFVGPRFKWNTTLTFAANKEKVIKTTSEQPLQFGSYYLIPGQPIHTYYGYKYLGIWGTAEADEAAKYDQRPGDVHVAENGEKDYVLNTDDYYILGSATPKWTGSMLNTFEFCNFDLSMLIIARWDYTMAYGITGWYRANGLSPSPSVCDYWTPENQNGRYPRPDMSAGGQVNYQSSIDYYDGSYWKIKTLSLGYNVPKKYLRKAHIEKLRLYFTADNLFIHTKSRYLKDYDPEKGGDDDYAPLSRQYVFGVNISF